MSQVPEGFEPDPVTPEGFTPETATPPQKPADSEALALAVAGHIMPTVQRAALEFATNPTLRKTASDVGQLVGAGAGMLNSGPIGAASGMWAGGKAGWRLTSYAQKLGVPVAKLMERVAPYAQALSTLSGAQGVLDLAQMAEPERQDIGVLGVGKTVPMNPEAAKAKAAAMQAQSAKEDADKAAAWQTLHDDIAAAVHKALTKVSSYAK